MSMAEIEADPRVIEKTARLNKGFDLIDAARAKGEDTDRWERRWLALLAEYETLVDDLRQPTPEPEPVKATQVAMSGMPEPRGKTRTGLPGAFQDQEHKQTRPRA
jgi:hypothetical protein